MTIPQPGPEMYAAVESANATEETFTPTELAMRYGYCPCGAPLRVLWSTDGTTMRAETVCSVEMVQSEPSDGGRDG